MFFLLILNPPVVRLVLCVQRHQAIQVNPTYTQTLISWGSLQNDDCNHCRVCSTWCPFSPAAPDGPSAPAVPWDTNTSCHSNPLLIVRFLHFWENTCSVTPLNVNIWMWGTKEQEDCVSSGLKASVGVSFYSHWKEHCFSGGTVDTMTMVTVEGKYPLTRIPIGPNGPSAPGAPLLPWGPDFPTAPSGPGKPGGP